MSFCNPTTLDDYLLPTPEEAAKPAESINAAAGTPGSFAIDIPPPAPSSVDKGKELHNNVIKAAGQLASTANIFNQIGFNAKTVENAVARIGASINKTSIKDFFKNFLDAGTALNNIEKLLAKALGLDSSSWFKKLLELEEQMGPFLKYADAFSKFLTDGVTIGDAAFNALFTGLADLSASIFGPDNGITKALVGITNLIAEAEAAANFFLGSVDALEDAAIAALDIAESLMATGLGLAAAICDFIPAFIAMARSVWEGIIGLIDFLLHFDITKIKLDIDFSKLFKLPSIDLFRKLRDRWDKFSGTAFKLWQTTSTECSPAHFNDVLGAPGRISEAAGSLGKVLALGAQFATAAVDAPEGISKIDSNLLARLGGLSLDGSLVKLRPAVVSSNPSIPELAGKSGTLIQASGGAIDHPNGMGSLNGAKAHDIDPVTGVPVRPGVFDCTSNNLEHASDLCGQIRATEVLAASAFTMGRSIKQALQPGATDAHAKQALIDVFNGTRRVRFAQSAITKFDGSEQSLISKDYFACHTNATARKHPVANTDDALQHLTLVFNQPAGVPGSVMERAAINNPDVFATANNNVGATNAKDTATTNVAPVPGVVSKFSILGTMTAEPTAPALDPSIAVSSPSVTAIDNLLLKMPFAAMSPTFYDTTYQSYLINSISEDGIDYNKQALYMVCRDLPQVNRLNIILELNDLLVGVEPAVAEGLYQKALLQGLLTDNGYTWLAVGKKVAFDTPILDQITNFLLHSRNDIHAMFDWLASSTSQNIVNPELPLNLTPQETDLADRSYRFLRSAPANLSQIILDMRAQADSIGGPMGFEFTMFLTAEAILDKIEARILNGENMKDQLEKLQPFVDKLTYFKVMSQQIKALANGKF